MGVKEVKLKELLLVFRNGASIKQFEGAEGLPITRIETISDATINPLKVGYANIFDDKYQDYYLQEGDILLSHINSVTHLGKCAIYTNPIDKLIHKTALQVLHTQALSASARNPLFSVLKKTPVKFLDESFLWRMMK